jgi:CRISPR-associated protein Cas6
MSFWPQSPVELAHFVVPKRISELSFAIQCPALPVDHLKALTDAFKQVIKDWQNLQSLQVMPIYVAESGNGWMRPIEPSALIFPSRRSRWSIRLATPQAATLAARLDGVTLSFGEMQITLSEPRIRALVPSSTLFSRYIVCNSFDSENDFLHNVYCDLQSLGVSASRMLAGRSNTIAGGDEALFTRSLMVADLTLADSITLQEHGVGNYLHSGCGIFIPHKSI